MSFKFSDLIDFGKIPIKIFLLFGIVSGILLFSSAEFLKDLKLSEFENDYGKFFGIVFIVCIAFIGLSILYFIKNKIERKLNYNKNTKYIVNELSCLDPFEQAVIREFTIQQRQTVTMPIDNAIVAGLLNKRILKQVSNIGDGLYLPLSLSKIVNEKLKETDLGISQNMSDEQLREVFSKRPKWADDYFYKQHFG
ncbi:super-infection exclusion protein B [Mesonia ostreae]|uniref:Super-infection exclusion protein B n=1 Tax=Mesonia ostreae TaxID=861110 RepID=A0ABU2KGY0_9FLAO|nr:super-infection exclusion protein B [Mesonia ostreae]MDT0293975.1 super-infection exclusion protein B [Mesonia ostreae]